MDPGWEAGGENAAPRCSQPEGGVLVSSVHGIFQARVLEWGAIFCSNSLLF